ncbi:hypothetical protein UP10_15530 [Bradyrhizobium sp. LTSPM299]|uniref:hypothetical protein n=1 Tax=Bradyrhizobium sp. LTSPM299 TaxID=1619233 RepID=UPI0005E2EB52|nr:hypothetical protein [Bradyrhizobium sp. LTSPM299]KJC60077.1 hypothetical protein UP10_15530 [Bradyrhizobium sp. LTSPM299]
MSEKTLKQEFPLVIDTSGDKKPSQFRVDDNERGVVLTVNASNGTASSVLFAKLDEASPLAQMTAYAGEAAKTFVADVAGLHERFKGDELTNRVRGAAAARFGKTCGQIQNIGLKETRDVATSRATLTAVDPATIANAHLRADALVKWNAADRAGQETIASSDATSYETTAALIEIGALSSVSDRARDAAIERYMAQRWLAKSGSTAAHEIQPSFERPLATGVDHSAAREAAKREIDKLNARSEAVTNVEDMLRRICDVLSLATDMPPRDIYKTFDRK